MHTTFIQRDNHPFHGAARMIGIFGLAALMTSCTSAPRYTVYPTLSLTNRMARCSDWWTKPFTYNMAQLSENEWSPSSSMLASTYEPAATNYSFAADSRSTMLALANRVFADTFKIDGEDKRGNGATSNIVAMARLIDLEHPNLLVPTSRYRNAPVTIGGSLPSLVSGSCPVDVAVTRWSTPEKKDEAVKTSATNLVFIANNFCGATDGAMAKAVEVGGKSAGKAGAAKDAGTGAAFACDAADFSPEQTLTLSVSTVLNSPSILDRIEYVSTYVWIEAFPFPPDGDVVLEDEFWRRFFGLNAFRHRDIRARAATNDMRRAIEEMRVRITDVDTTVNLRTVDLGTLEQTSTSKFGGGLAGTVGIPGMAATISPSATYNSDDNATLSQKLQQELDQRSTYVDAYGHFLRITQRGMRSVNLAGRFLEQLKLRVPVANGMTAVLVPKGKTYAVRWVSTPLYSRVDALTFSVVVARQTTALASNKRIYAGLPDPNDAAFIVGVSRPDRITLWEHERRLDPVRACDIWPSAPPSRRILFAPATTNANPAPLVLCGFSQDQKCALLDALRKTAGAERLLQPVFYLAGEAAGTGSSAPEAPKPGDARPVGSIAGCYEGPAADVPTHVNTPFFIKSVLFSESL